MERAKERREAPIFKGKRYWKDGDRSVVLIYDANGYIAGIQAGIPRSAFKREDQKKKLMGVHSEEEDNSSAHIPIVHRRRRQANTDPETISQEELETNVEDGSLPMFTETQYWKNMDLNAVYPYIADKFLAGIRTSMPKGDFMNEEEKMKLRRIQTKEIYLSSMPYWNIFHRLRRHTHSKPEKTSVRPTPSGSPQTKRHSTTTSSTLFLKKSTPASSFVTHKQAFKSTPSPSGIPRESGASTTFHKTGESFVPTAKRLESAKAHKSSTTKQPLVSRTHPFGASMEPMQSTLFLRRKHLEQQHTPLRFSRMAAKQLIKPHSVGSETESASLRPTIPTHLNHPRERKLLLSHNMNTHRPVIHHSVEDDDVVYFTVYFINPERICDPERSRSVDEFEHWGTGSDLFMQNGTHVNSFIQIPRDERKLQSENLWNAEKCLWTQGQIYSYNFDENRDCHTLFPLLLNYNRGRLTGFALLFKMDFPSPYVEHPDKGLLRFMFKKVPKCYYEIGRLTKLQFFLTNDFLSRRSMQKLVTLALVCFTGAFALPLNKNSTAGKLKNFQTPRNFVWNSWEVFKKLGIWHPGLMDEWDEQDQDSPIADLLQTMIVFDAKGIPHKTKTVIHELMHAIGQMHEQQRTDRDQYIDILFNNIPQNGRHNFDISDTFDRTPYDVESIMQYPLTSFSQNGGKTMQLKDTRLEVLIDTAKTFTHNDIKEITIAYQCTESCQNLPDCQNEGFVAHTCQCLCPSELTGATCEQVITDTGCGGVINLSSGQSQFIESPGYPNAVSNDKECVWLVRGPSGSNIRLRIDELQLAMNNFDSKCYHWLEIRYNMIGQSGIRQCNTANNQTYTTTNDGESNLMLLKFDSRFNKNTQTSQGQRFKLNVKAEGGSSSNPCDPNPCLNSGTCTVVGSTFDCSCTTGWTGTTCDVPVLSCQPNPCQNGGTCAIIGNSVSCDCPPGWIGPNCETSSVATTTTTTTTTTVSPPTGTSRLCNFETSNCWMEKFGDLFSVQVSSSMEPYAGFLNTARYGYLLPGSSFILESPSGTLSNGQFCLSFGFYINGYYPSMSVYLRNMYQQMQGLWFYNQSTYGNWYSVEIPFYGPSSDHIAIEGYISYGTFAIDEIRLLDGACPAGVGR
ncbi:uncharacterized protein LOC133186981 [Saccostrea echinata]|uniref:uncharacterized protein LOC133186981 n=1 Tax=Saccostrea echinata TaxID=191078 RepID=UPI002A81DB44|nr:uncharacterized protein LOC133186981 [Saccostrea echinata]